MRREVENKSVWFCKSHLPEQGHTNVGRGVRTIMS